MVWWALLNSVTAHSFPPTCWYQACAVGEKADQLPINSRSTPEQGPRSPPAAPLLLIGSSSQVPPAGALLSHARQRRP